MLLVSPQLCFSVTVHSSLSLRLPLFFCVSWVFTCHLCLSLFPSFSCPPFVSFGPKNIRRSLWTTIPDQQDLLAKLWPHPVSAPDFQVENGILSEHKSDHDSQVHSFHPPCCPSVFLGASSFPQLTLTRTGPPLHANSCYTLADTSIVSSFGTFPLQRVAFSQILVCLSCAPHFCD